MAKRVRESETSSSDDNKSESENESQSQEVGQHINKKRRVDKESEEDSSEEGSGDESEDDSEEDDSEEENEDGDGDEDEVSKSKGKREFNDEEEYELSHKYRLLNKKLEEQRPQLTTDEGIVLVNETLNRADNLFEGTKMSSNTMILAKDSSILNEIGEQAKIATMNVKFGLSNKAIKFDSFLSSWKSIFGVVDQYTNENEDENDEDDNIIPMYNWENSGLLFNSLSSHVIGCDYLLGPLEIEKKKRIIKQRLVDDSKNSDMKTANLKTADDVVNKDSKDNTSKAAEKMLIKLRQHNSKISLFEAILHPTSFGKSIECLFVTSFLINNGYLTLKKFENGIPYLQIISKSLEEVSDHPRYKSNDDSRSHIVFSLDEATWKQLVQIFEIKEPFFSND